MYNKSVIQITCMKLLDCLSDKEKNLGRVVSFKKGNILFHENDKCEYIGIVIKGEIQISSYSLSGQEIIYNTIKKDEMFGNNLLFSESPFYRGNVMGKEDGDLILFPKSNLLTILKNNDEFLTIYLQVCADFSKSLNAQIKLLSLSSAEERLIFFLENHSPYHYKSVAGFAKTLYLSRETLSRLISKMIKEGKIKKKGNTLYL